MTTQRRLAPSGPLRASVLAAILLALGAAAQEGSVARIGSRRELFVDRYLIDTASGVELRLHQPMPKEIAMHLERPWEGNTCI